MCFLLLLKWKLELDEIIEVAQVDSEQWVSMLAEMMRNYPSTNCLQTDINDADENARIYYDLVQDLGKKCKLFLFKNDQIPLN